MIIISLGTSFLDITVNAKLAKSIFEVFHGLQYVYCRGTYCQMYVITCLLYGWVILPLFMQMGCSAEADRLGALPSGWGEFDLSSFLT